MSRCLRLSKKKYRANLYTFELVYKETGIQDSGTSFDVLHSTDIPKKIQKKIEEINNRTFQKETVILVLKIDVTKNTIFFP